MQQALIQLIQSTCAPNKFLNIDANFIHPISAFPSANIADVSDVAILASIKKYSKVVLSPEYELNIEKEYKKKLQEAEGKGGSIVAEKERKIAERDSTIASLNTKVSTLQNQISGLEQDSKKKDTEIQQLKQKGELSQLVAKIKEPIVTIAEYFRVQDTPKHSSTPKYSRKNYLLGVFSSVLSIIILVLCVLSLSRNSSVTPDENKKEGKFEAQVNSLNKEIQRLTGTLKLKNDTIAELRKSIPSTQVHAAELRIDISGKDINGARFSANKIMSTNQTYTITIFKKSVNQKLSNDEGTWTLTNATLKTGNLTDAQITIQPNNSGDVKIAYTPHDPSQFEYKSRSEKAQEPSSSTTVAKVTMSPNVKSVKEGEEYTFTVTGYTGAGRWQMDGFSSSSPEDRLQPQITVVIDKANATKGKAIINYYKEDGTQIQGGEFPYED